VGHFEFLGEYGDLGSKVASLRSLDRAEFGKYSFSLSTFSSDVVYCDQTTMNLGKRYHSATIRLGATECDCISEGP
jgi:hypothetical protein